MNYLTKQLKEDLYTLGIRHGDTVLMHSSYKSLGGIDGGAQAFFDTFIELLGEEGTLVLPALSFQYVTRENPVFDLNETPSCTGYLSEFFRTNVNGVIRSTHATHSCCAYGRLARELTKNHELDITPVGENSPFSKLPKHNGKILMLGCGNFPNTSMHGVEETAEPPYCIDRKNPIEYTLITDDNVIHQKAYRHNFIRKDGTHYTQRYDRIVALLSDSEVSAGAVLSAECCLMDAGAIWEKGNKKLREEPFYFVD